MQGVGDMCLAVPGKIVRIKADDVAVHDVIANNATVNGAAANDTSMIGTIATVDFQGSRVDVSLALVPQAQLGDWVLVHAGFALNVLDEQEAVQTWKYLQESGFEHS